MFPRLALCCVRQPPKWPVEQHKGRAPRLLAGERGDFNFTFPEFPDGSLAQDRRHPERVPCQTPKCPLVRKHCPQTNSHGVGSVRGKMSFGGHGEAQSHLNPINEEMAIGVPVMRQGTGSTGLSRRRVREGSTKSKIAMRWTRVEA
jgi:hypothetical protein